MLFYSFPEIVSSVSGYIISLYFKTALDRLFCIILFSNARAIVLVTVVEQRAGYFLKKIETDDGNERHL